MCYWVGIVILFDRYLRYGTGSHFGKVVSHPISIFFFIAHMVPVPVLTALYGMVDVVLKGLSHEN